MGDATVSQFVPQSDMRSGIHLVATPAEWIEPLTSYDSFQRAASLPKSTRKMRNWQMRRFATDVAKGPFDVRLDDIVEYLSHNWAPNTKAAYRTTIRSFYRWAALSDRIGRNPAEFVPIVKLEAGRPRPAAEAVVRDSSAAAPERERLMIELAAYAGLRCCEIATVHSRNLVIRGSGKKRRAMLTVKGKGGKTRVIPISKKRLVKRIVAANGWLFPGKIEGHISPAYVSRLVSRALGAGTTAHRLRHRFATEALRGTKDLRAVQELLGHSSLATTQVYTHVAEDDLWDAVQAAA